MIHVSSHFSMATQNPSTIRAVLKVDPAKIRWLSHPTVSSLMQLTAKAPVQLNYTSTGENMKDIRKSGECSQGWKSQPVKARSDPVN